jgi:hypothetical protein
MPQTARSNVSYLNVTKHDYEQLAYHEIRKALSDSFIAAPEDFVKHFGCRPEDLKGHQLREYYPHFLVQQLPIESTNEGFRRRFYEGRIF